MSTSTGQRVAMEPRVQYAHTVDAVSIACWTLGDGRRWCTWPAGRGATSSCGRRRGAGVGTSGWHATACSSATTCAALTAIAQFDVTDLLPRVQAPTLVLHRRDVPWLPVARARDAATRMRDARLTLLDGDSTERHTRNIYRKFHARGRADATASRWCCIAASP